MIVVEDMQPASDNQALALRMSTDGGSTFISTSTYEWAAKARSSSTTSYALGGTQSWIPITPQSVYHDNSTNGRLYGFIYINSPEGSGTYCHTHSYMSGVEDTPEIVMYECSGLYNVAADVDAIQLLMTSGNIDTGTFTLYGLDVT